MKDKNLSIQQFNAVIGFFLLYGAGVTALGVKFLSPLFVNWNVWGLILAYIITVIIGTAIAFKSDKPIVSFIGYTLVTVTTGILIGFALEGFGYKTIVNALLVTIGVIVIMGIAAWLKPSFFLRLGPVLVLSLFALVIVELIMFAFHLAEPNLIDIIAAALFSLFIGYDWAKAQKSEITLDGAIDSCVSLYIDAVNLFLRTAGLMDNDD